MRAALALLLLAGCSGTASPPESGLAGTEWLLVALRGAPPVPGSRITLRFDEREAGGHGGCNSYGGAYRIRGSAIEWKEIRSTLRACADEAFMEQERRFVGAMNEVETYRIEGERLLLSDQDGTTLLEWSRLRRLPTEPTGRGRAGAP